MKIIPYLLLIFLIGNNQRIKAEDVQQNIVPQPEKEIPRSVVDSLLKPAAMAETGSYIGKAAAKLAKQKQFPKRLIVKNISAEQPTINNINELLYGLRPTDNNLPSIKLQNTSLSIIAKYGIVVVGGGTSGAPAAIAACLAIDENLAVQEINYGKLKLTLLKKGQILTNVRF